MKTLKTILQEVISGIKAWVDTNTVHKSGDETINGVKTFPDGIVANVSVDSITWEDIKDKPSSFTPVAHTHTKSDVTNLLNSNFIPSANNSYDLGSSSYQWNNLYAKNYYYNGTAWGLDKANTWTGTNTFTTNNLYHIADVPSYILKSSTMQEGVIPSGNKTAYTGYWMDKNLNILGYDRFVFYSTGLQTYEVNIRNKATNGSFDPNGSPIQSGFQLSLYPSGNSELKIYAHTLPNGNGVWNLGDSTNKWKSFNGINPGALSLPDYANAVSIDTTSWNTTGNKITYTPLISGWLQITIPGDVGNLLAVLDSGNSPFSGQEFDGVGSTRIYLTYPVIANRKYWIFIKTSSIITARIVPCLGNV